MPPIPGSPVDNDDDDKVPASAVSPINLSGALPPVMPRYPPEVYTLDPGPGSPSEDVIPEEHRRVPGLIPRSPLSPVERVSRAFSMARRQAGLGRRAMTPVVVVQGPERKAAVLHRYEEEDGKEFLVESAVVVGDEEMGQGRKMPKRKTVWGWWDLGLLERMGTVRRKR